MNVADRRRALEDASIPALLMCLAQITGDETWLQPPYTPKRDISIFADPSGGLPTEVQDEIRSAISAVLDDLASGKRSLPGLPSQEKMTRMMSVFLGETVPSEYAGIALEEMGLTKRAIPWSEHEVPVFDHDGILVVGAGFSGICAGYHLKHAGLKFTIIEKHHDVGGVWLENDYPESGVDTPNHFYSFTFAPNLNWTSNYSKRDEVWSYQKNVFTQVGLQEHTEFNTELVEMRWDDENNLWEVSTKTHDGAVRKRKFWQIISATGNLNIPMVPSIPGLDRFQGQWWHSSNWRHDIDLKGKNVAVVGTGASAMQFLRSIAAQAKKVTIFQRSPQWARPPQDYHGKTSSESRWLLEHIPYYYGWYRFGLMWRYGDSLLPTIKKDPQWPHPERSMNKRNENQRVQLTAYLREQLEGRDDLFEKCLPDYPPYGKRILIDNGWFQTLKQPNVELVTEGVSEIAGDQVRTPSGQSTHADVIIFATGFRPDNILGSVNITGKNGKTLKDTWGDDPKAYLGMNIPGFPNLYVMAGPNSGLAHGGSAILVAECQVWYIMSLIKTMFANQVRSADVRTEVHDDYNESVDREHAQLVWAHPGMNNWYKNAKGRVFAPMPWRLVDYWSLTRQPTLSDYHIKTSQSSSVSGGQI